MVKLKIEGKLYFYNDFKMEKYITNEKYKELLNDEYFLKLLNGNEAEIMMCPYGEFLMEFLNIQIMIGLKEEIKVVEVINLNEEETLKLYRHDGTFNVRGKANTYIK